MRNFLKGVLVALILGAIFALFAFAFPAGLVALNEKNLRSDIPTWAQQIEKAGEGLPGETQVIASFTGPGELVLAKPDGGTVLVPMSFPSNRGNTIKTSVKGTLDSFTINVSYPGMFGAWSSLTYDSEQKDFR